MDRFESIGRILPEELDREIASTSLDRCPALSALALGRRKFVANPMNGAEMSRTCFVALVSLVAPRRAISGIATLRLNALVSSTSFAKRLSLFCFNYLDPRANRGQFGTLGCSSQSAFHSPSHTKRCDPHRHCGCQNDYGENYCPVRQEVSPWMRHLPDRNAQ